ncbi:unnamed protein product [Onchocerca flexuosa]|uniref:Secreted protein n=1 Tax=Onchocerca flexuosa TaxID=387005 RepID=A0A183HF35_9BILA|nr:unnamed protein product [Onchocerca flexuosa]
MKPRAMTTAAWLTVLTIAKKVATVIMVLRQEHQENGTDMHQQEIGETNSLIDSVEAGDLNDNHCIEHFKPHFLVKSIINTIVHVTRPVKIEHRQQQHFLSKTSKECGIAIRGRYSKEEDNSSRHDGCEKSSDDDSTSVQIDSFEIEKQDEECPVSHLTSKMLSTIDELFMAFYFSSLSRQTSF